MLHHQIKLRIINEYRRPENQKKHNSSGFSKEMGGHMGLLLSPGTGRGDGAHQEPLVEVGKAPGARQGQGAQS